MNYTIIIAGIAVSLLLVISASIIGILFMLYL